MKIIYRQPPQCPIFNSVGIVNCHVRELGGEKDIIATSKKEHHHTFFETHIIISGHQSYKIQKKSYKITGGNLLITPPRLKHIVTETSKNTKKISINFAISEKSPYWQFANTMNRCIQAKLPERVADSIKYILEEHKERSNQSEILIQNRIYEIIIIFFRLCGFYPENKQIEKPGEDVRLSMAKQYIKDNIELNPKLPEVASYCYISTKQLTRLFKTFENVTPAMYIQAKKYEYIEKLLSETDMSLKDISEKMNFSSEYHFNSFFKKIAGTPPGEYRTLIGNKG